MPWPLAWASSASASLPESAVGASETAAAQQPAVHLGNRPTSRRDKTQRRKPIKQNSPQAQKTQSDKNILYKFYDSEVWPKILGKKLGIETWNAGRLGTSNDNIVRTTLGSIDYLESIGKTDLFVVIGLTSLMRYETWNQDEGIGKWVDKRIDKKEWVRETTKKKSVNSQRLFKYNKSPIFFKDKKHTTFNL